MTRWSQKKETKPSLMLPSHWPNSNKQPTALPNEKPQGRIYGIPIEFYTLFWDMLGPTLLETL